MIKLIRLTDEEMSKAYISAPEPYKECQMRDVAQAQLSKSKQEANEQLKAELRKVKEEIEGRHGGLVLNIWGEYWQTYWDKKLGKEKRIEEK